MKLSDYLRARGESESEFARRVRLPQRTINRICGGAGCNAKTALLIIRETHNSPTAGGGTVSLEDLVTDEADSRAAS